MTDYQHVAYNKPWSIPISLVASNEIHEGNGEVWFLTNSYVTLDRALSQGASLVFIKIYSKRSSKLNWVSRTNLSRLNVLIISGFKHFVLSHNVRWGSEEMLKAITNARALNKLLLSEDLFFNLVSLVSCQPHKFI